MLFLKRDRDSYKRIAVIKANVENISNLIGRERYNIGRIVLSASVWQSLTK